jgi:hypothetical protein
MLLCKQTCCCWYLVYVNCPEITNRRSAAFRKGDDNVQDRFHRARTLQWPARPPDGVDRPPAHGQRPHRIAQRRSPLFRTLKHKGCDASALQAHHLGAPHRVIPPKRNSSQTMAPISGPFFFAFLTAHRFHVRQISQIDDPSALIVCTLAYRIPRCAKVTLRNPNRSVHPGGSMAGKSSEGSGCRAGKPRL